jgi:uncharacterized cupredoxin-like copper-binding protein
MTRRRTLTAALVSIGLIGGAPGAVSAGAAPLPVIAHTDRAPARLLVYAQEWSLWPSRSSVPAGAVIVQLWNRGQDAHDMKIRRLNYRGAMIGRTLGEGIAQSGQIKQAAWNLGRGTYELYCDMPGHYKAGMHTRLTIR